MIRILKWLTGLLGDPRVIYDRVGGSPYLSRWYLLGRREDGSRWWSPLDLYLHRFHRGDDDRALHSHPWSWAVALVLAGGYIEERRVGDSVVRRIVRPFRVVFLTSDTYHRVDLLGDESWSLFLAGPKVGTWYFWDRALRAKRMWKLHIKSLRGQGQYAWQKDSRDVS